MPGTEAIARSTGGALAGAGLGELTVRGVRRLPAEQRVLYAAGLAIVAAIYPTARRRWRFDRSSVGELLGVVGYGTASVVAARRPPPRATRLLAAGWPRTPSSTSRTATTKARGCRARTRRCAPGMTWSSPATLRARPEQRLEVARRPRGRSSAVKSR
jgi:hypothetical protein